MEERRGINVAGIEVRIHWTSTSLLKSSVEIEDSVSESLGGQSSPFRPHLRDVTTLEATVESNPPTKTLQA